MDFFIKKELTEREAELLRDFGSMLADGLVFEKNLHTAFACFCAAAEAGNGEAMDDVGWCLEHGIDVEQDFDHAYQAYVDAGNHGCNSGWYHAGRLLGSGKLSNGPDFEQAFTFYSRAAEQGSINAKYEMAVMLLEGKEIPGDQKHAMHLFEELNASGHKDAPFYLGLCWQEGYGTKPDYTKARRYYRMGALNGDACCYNQLGVLYGKGLGVEQDNRAAFDYYSIAAEMDDATACFNIGCFYESGKIGEKPDAAEAVKWYRKAKALGHQSAADRLIELEIPEEDDSGTPDTM